MRERRHWPRVSSQGPLAVRCLKVRDGRLRGRVLENEDAQSRPDAKKAAAQIEPDTQRPSPEPGTPAKHSLICSASPTPAGREGEGAP